jgi:hypothetical protein
MPYFFMCSCQPGCCGHSGAASDDPREKLLALMKLLTKQSLGQYDVAIRAWATQDSKLHRQCPMISISLGMAPQNYYVARKRFEHIRPG